MIGVDTVAPLARKAAVRLLSAFENAARGVSEGMEAVEAAASAAVDVLTPAAIPLPRKEASENAAPSDVNVIPFPFGFAGAREEARKAAMLRHPSARREG